MHLHGAPLVRASALLLGLAAAWACGSSEADDCPQGSDGCACAFNLCDDGLTCIADVCVADGTSTDPSTTIDPSTTNPATTDVAEESSSDDGAESSTGLDDSSGSTGEPPSTDPIYDATVDGIPTTYDGDPHAYISPAGTLIVRGTDNFGAEMLLRIPPTGPGTYPCVLDETGVAIYYTQDGPIGPIEMSTRTSGICMITLDTFGDVGEFVSGSFEGEVVFPGAMEIPPVVITDGIFNVIRTPDES
jgi:hypothetical protein